ncbi:MAG TPA: hypothetical protein VM387_05135, partial [Gemmatimonadales bacterium]|nr:hypothetical protein [Gemmatimonadales bacterium]
MALTLLRRAAAGVFMAASARGLAAQAPPIQALGDSVQVRFVDTDLRAVIQAMGQYLPKPVLEGNVPGVRVSLETPVPVSRDRLATLLRGLVEAQNLVYTEDSAFIRIGPAPAVAPVSATPAAQPEDIRLFVIRLKHARAADVAATVNLL